MNASYLLELYESGYRDFGGIHLSGADLSQHILVDVDLQRASLIGARLCRAFLTKAALTDANLHRADCSFAKLSEANLLEFRLKRIIPLPSEGRKMDYSRMVRELSDRF